MRFLRPVAVSLAVFAMSAMGFASAAEVPNGTLTVNFDGLNMDSNYGVYLTIDSIGSGESWMVKDTDLNVVNNKYTYSATKPRGTYVVGHDFYAKNTALTTAGGTRKLVRPTKETHISPFCPMLRMATILPGYDETVNYPINSGCPKPDLRGVTLSVVFNSDGPFGLKANVSGNLSHYQLKYTWFRPNGREGFVEFAPTGQSHDLVNGTYSTIDIDDTLKNAAVMVEVYSGQTRVAYAVETWKVLAYTGGSSARVKASALRASLNKALTFTAQGFEPGENVSFTVHSTPVEVGTVQADADGVAKIEWTVPADFEVGNHKVVARGATSGNTAEDAFEVVEAGTSVVPPVTPTATDAKQQPEPTKTPTPNAPLGLPKAGKGILLVPGACAPLGSWASHVG